MVCRSSQNRDSHVTAVSQLLAEMGTIWHQCSLLKFGFLSEDSTRQYLATVRAGVRNEKVGVRFISGTSFNPR